MQLDRIIISTRPRHGWSAIDLGVKLAVKHYLSCFILFLVIAAPFIMVTVFFKDNYWLSYLFIWWLKPFFERPILFYLSRELFGEKTNIFSVLAQWKSWIHPGLFSGLSYRRLTPYRSFFMPLTVLESLGGNAYAKRALVLGSRFGSKSGWLTIVSYHIEVFFYFGFIVLIELMAPAQFNILEFLSQEGGFNIIVSSLLQILIFAMIAPFYVASGFMLYIARRIQLEGWDIELQFRDWVAKNAN